MFLFMFQEKKHCKSCEKGKLLMLKTVDETDTVVYKYEITYTQKRLQCLSKCIWHTKRMNKFGALDFQFHMDPLYIFCACSFCSLTRFHCTVFNYHHVIKYTIIIPNIEHAGKLNGSTIPASSVSEVETLVCERYMQSGLRRHIYIYKA